jgi:2-keto-myo-inositol isomerase
MRYSFNGASTMKSDLPGDIRAAAQAGFDLLEIWAKKMEAYLSQHSVEDLKGLFRNGKVEPLAINSVEFITFNASWEKTNTINLIQRYADLADKLSCPYIVLVPSPRPRGISDKKVHEESVNVLLETSDRFKAYKVKFGFEFLGFGWCSVTTLEQAFKIVKTVNRDNIGLIIDSFHFFVGGSSIESIKKINPQKIFIFHINDAEKFPKAKLQDAHRLYPGKGGIPLKQITAKLKEIRYDGPVSLEMFRPEYWTRPAEEVARKGMRAIRRFV